jgi:hypothetical protein
MGQSLSLGRVLIPLSIRLGTKALSPLPAALEGFWLRPQMLKSSGVVSGTAITSELEVLGASSVTSQKPGLHPRPKKYSCPSGSLPLSFGPPEPSVRRGALAEASLSRSSSPMGLLRAGVDPAMPYCQPASMHPGCTCPFSCSSNQLL